MTKRWNGLLVYDKEGAKRNASYIKMHEEVGKKLNMPIHFLYDEDVMEYLEINRESVDFCMVRTICSALTKQIEARGIPCFNSSFVSEICNHKGKTYDYILKNCEIPLVKTKTFQNIELSEKLLKEYPDYVIKAVDGHGGKQVFLTNESFDLIQTGIASSDFILQSHVKAQRSRRGLTCVHHWQENCGCHKTSGKQQLPGKFFFGWKCYVIPMR